MKTIVRINASPRLAVLAGAFALCASAAGLAQEGADVHAAETAKGAADPGQASEAAYQAHCAACHQPNDQGLPGAFPPLAGNPNVTGDPDYVIGTVLNGRQGELVVDGTTYNGVMPPMQYLSDTDIAQSVNYVLTAWGNDGETVGVEQVAAARAQLGQTDRAEGQRHQGVTEGQMKYQGTPSTVPGGPMVTTPGAPDLNQAEFDRSQQLNFERCAGCHGVLRKGATGKRRPPTSPGRRAPNTSRR